MKMNPSAFNLLTAMLLLAVSGCGKKEEAAPAVPVAATSEATPTAATATAAPAQTAVVPDARLAESQTAINTRNYEKAAEALVALQHAKLNEQQAAAAAAQMRQLQGNLAAAVASGDPRAKAAADLLRQSATVR